MLTCALILALSGFTQGLKEKDVPEPVRSALHQKFPQAVKVTWEKEKGDFEANWGGRSGEDHSALFSPNGKFLELVDAISPDELPAPILPYIRQHYPGAKVREAGKVMTGDGKTMYEAEIKGKDLIFDDLGRFLKED